MKKNKAVHVTKRDIRQHSPFREYQLYANNVISSIEHHRHGRRTKEVGVQYNSRKDLVCTCRHLSGLRRHHEARFFCASPKQIYAYHRSRSFTEVGVGGVIPSQRRRVRRVYLPATDDRGVGSSEITTFNAHKPKSIRVNSYYDQIRTSSKCVGGAVEDPLQCVVSVKLSPIAHTKSGTTSPHSYNTGKDTKIGSYIITEQVTNTTQMDTPKISEDKKSVAEAKRKVSEEIKPKEPSVLVIKPSPTPKPSEKKEDKESKDRTIKDAKSFSSDSLVTRVTNFDNPSEIKPSVDPLIENKIEREYRKMFKEDKPESSIKTIPNKSTSLFRRRFTALKKSLGKKDSKTVPQASSHSSIASVKDASVTSDPPSLVGRSYSNTTAFSTQNQPLDYPKSSHKTTRNQNWSKGSTIDSEYASGVKGMFKIWGKKFNLDDSYHKDTYKKESEHSRADSYSKTPSCSKKNTPQSSFETKHETEIKEEIEIPETVKSDEKEEPKEKERKEKRKFSFFRRKKSKDKEKQPYNQKKGVTTGRCEVKDGLSIKIGAAPQPPPAPLPERKNTPEKIPGTYQELLRAAWLMKFLTTPVESRNSVNIRWNNNTYATSSSTIFELMENVYKDTGVILKSKSEIATDDSSSNYREYHKQNVNFIQNVEAWMVRRTIPDKKLPIKVNKEEKHSKADNMALSISEQKRLLDKSKAFAHRIEVVLHSNNLMKPGTRMASSEYLRIDIPHGFFSDDSGRTSSDDPQVVHTSDEEVYKIVEYESKTNDNLNEIYMPFKPRNILHHDTKNIQVTVSVKGEMDKESKILETVIKRPPTHRDVVTQGEKVYFPKTCDVIGVGIITQRDLREMEVRQPIIRVVDYISDEESRSNHSLQERRTCGFAESYLQEFYKHYQPLGFDLYSWCVSDSHLKCYSDECHHNLVAGDGSKSCPNILEDYEAVQSAEISASQSPLQSFAFAEQNNMSQKDKATKRKNGKIVNRDNGNDLKFVRILPKDSLEVFKNRKVYAIEKSKWEMDKQPYSTPSNADRGVQNDSRRCSSKKVILPDSDVIKQGQVIVTSSFSSTDDIITDKVPGPGILVSNRKKDKMKESEKVPTEDPSKYETKKVVSELTLDAKPSTRNKDSNKSIEVAVCSAPDSTSQVCVAPRSVEFVGIPKDCNNETDRKSNHQINTREKCSSKSSPIKDIYPWPMKEQIAQHASSHIKCKSSYTISPHSINPVVNASIGSGRDCVEKESSESMKQCGKTVAAKASACSCRDEDEAKFECSKTCSMKRKRPSQPTPCPSPPVTKQSKTCCSKSSSTKSSSSYLPGCEMSFPDCTINFPDGTVNVPKEARVPDCQKDRDKITDAKSPVKCEPTNKTGVKNMSKTESGRNLTNTPEYSNKVIPKYPECTHQPKCQICKATGIQECPVDIPCPDRPNVQSKSSPKTSQPCPADGSQKKKPEMTSSHRSQASFNSQRCPPGPQCPATPVKCKACAPPKFPLSLVGKKNAYSKCPKECPSRPKCEPKPKAICEPKPMPTCEPEPCLEDEEEEACVPMSGIHLKVYPKRNTVSTDCCEEFMDVGGDLFDCALNTGGNHFKIVDEDGQTLVERENFGVQDPCQHDRELQVPVHRVATPTKPAEIEPAVKSKKSEKIKTSSSNSSVANVIEISFKLRMTNGDKTTKINVCNDVDGEEKKMSDKNNDNQVFVMKKENKSSENKTEELNPKNDLNIKILIKNYKSKSETKKHKQAVADFSENILKKFHTVSTGYSRDLKQPADVSVHKATIDLTASGEKSNVASAKDVKSKVRLLDENLSATRMSETIVQAANVTDYTDTEKSNSELLDLKLSRKDIVEKLYQFDTKLSMTDTDEPDNSFLNKTSDEPLDLGTTRSEDPTDLCNRTSEDQSITDVKSSEDIDSDTKTSELVLQRLPSDDPEIDLSKTEKEEKKEMLKQVFEQADYLNKPKTKTRMKKLKDIVKLILTSDSEPDLDYSKSKMKIINNIAKNLKTTKGMTFMPLYPSPDLTHGCCSGRNSDPSDEGDDKPCGCLCSTFAERLNAGGCCCRKAKSVHDVDITCDVIKNEDLELCDLDSDDSTERIDVDTQNSKYVNSFIVNKTQLRDTTASKTDLIKDSSATIIKNLSAKSSKSPKIELTPLTHTREFELRMLNTKTELGISKEDKICFMKSKTTMMNEKKSKHSKKGRNLNGADVLQLYETKKAVLEIYAEKTVTEEGEHIVAKLPKFVNAREDDSYEDYKEPKRPNFRICSKNFVMMSIGR